ncbi:2OG-Fe dioxygenase family protein [Streptomyces sp. JJ36]|uniref:2OG-Fe dioxygenase family protein n=1 Tax=Streptomyces sp. JJ36 TaxID=2736645 RepID=UPI001F21B58A|nr:2OG-Fe dioxygenase family protein [Streptomyces sp. JJ36]MCF6525841.1 2OG-Fe dioxygenase family protein [Streptomyces sp. JJ36]
MEEIPTVHDAVPAPATTGGVGDDLRRHGFARFRAADLGPSPATYGEDLARIGDAFTRLPPDPYAPATHRFRRYSHAVYLPWTRQLSFVPGAPDPVHGSVTEYWQDDHNPEYPHLRRRLPDIPAALRDNALLLSLVRADLAAALWLEELRRAPLYVGVHLIKLAVRDHADRAVSSPDCLHQDGGSRATFTFAHLIGCGNVRGGDNVIATPESAGRQPGDLPPGARHAHFVLTEPLDGYAVHDHRVSHYVAPVRRGDGPGHGERRILIVGVAPFAPRL